MVETDGSQIEDIEELVYTPAWRIRRGEEKRSVTIAVLCNVKLRSALREQADRRCTTISTYVEAILAKHIQSLREEAAAQTEEQAAA